MVDNQNQYNQLALQLSQLLSSSQGGNKAKIADIQAEMQKLEPQVNKDLQDSNSYYSDAYLYILRQEIEKTVASGGDITQLAEEYKKGKSIQEQYQQITQQKTSMQKSAFICASVSSLPFL